MKRFVPVLLVLGLMLAAGLTLTPAATGSSALHQVRIQHRDPGCHWIVTGGKLLKKLAVRGPVKLANFDIQALRIAPKSGKTKLVGVGKSTKLGRGTYRVAMVGQEKDDNTLKVVVR